MARQRAVVIISPLGITLDAPSGPDRFGVWRPSVALVQNPKLRVSRYYLLAEKKHFALLGRVADDIRAVSPRTEVIPYGLDIRDPWNVDEVFGALLDFAERISFDEEKEECLVHLTTGTHVVQICLFLLAESRVLPARLIQSVPPAPGDLPYGSSRIIDLTEARYDLLRRRFERRVKDDIARLKSGIATKNAEFNALMDEVERVAARSTQPVLLLGPTGSGKTLLARRIYEVRHGRGLVRGPLVEVNCATLKGDSAISALFGHAKGAFTGALTSRRGLLAMADGGVLFLDEVAELGLEEQAMLLRALEEKRFRPLGADEERRSDFQLVAATNRRLEDEVAKGRFREDLLARINLWTFYLPPLRERKEDIAPNVDHELLKYEQATGLHVAFAPDAREAYLAFAASEDATWPANFRDLSASVTRMATLAQGGHITLRDVNREIARLRSMWRRVTPAEDGVVRSVVPADTLASLDAFDRVQLEHVIRVCQKSRSLSEAGRKLFAVSRTRRRSRNDADRLRKYLGRFGLSWEGVKGGGEARPRP